MKGSAVAILFPAYPGAVDGIMGPETVAALEGLQTWAGVSGQRRLRRHDLVLTPGIAQ